MIPFQNLTFSGKQILKMLLTQNIRFSGRDKDSQVLVFKSMVFILKYGITEAPKIDNVNFFSAFQLFFSHSRNITLSCCQFYEFSKCGLQKNIRIKVGNF